MSRDSTESNTNIITGSTLNYAPVVAGSHAKVNVAVGSPDEDRLVADAIAELRQQLEHTKSELDRRDDETRESLDMAASRLNALEQELSEPKPKRDWTRVTKLLSGVRDAVAGLTSLTVSADALWEAVRQVIR